jgi:hypothetical protein
MAVRTPVGTLTAIRVRGGEVECRPDTGDTPGGFLIVIIVAIYR